MFKKGLSGVFAVLGNQQADWTLRIRALESLHGIMEEDEDGEILEELNRSFVQINHQLLDLRSKVCNQACIFLCATLQKYGVDAEGLADKLISKDSLLKLLSNGNKVLAEAGNETIKTVLTHVPTDRYLGKLIQELNQTKNIFVRERLSAYLTIILKEFGDEVLDKSHLILEKALLAGVCDSSAEVRKNTRAAFQAYSKRFYLRANALLKRMEPSAVKALKEDGKLDTSVNPSAEPSKMQQPRTGRIVRQPSLELKDHSRDITPQSKRRPLPAPQRELHEIAVDYNKQSNSGNKPKRQSYNNYLAKDSTERSSYDSRVNKSLSNVERSSMKGSSKRGRKDKPVHDWRTEDLEFLMSKANSDAWATRMMSFQKTYEVLMEIDRSQESIHEPTLISILAAFATHLEDPHVKISSFLVGCMPSIIENYPQLCAKHSQVILRRCLKGLAQCKIPQAREQFENLLECCKKYLSLDLMPHLLQYLEQAKTTRERVVCLDFLIQMLQEDPDCMETKNVGLTVKLMGNLINDHQKEKPISLPALAVMSLVKARNSAVVLNCLLSIGQNVLSKILELAGQIEPQLQGSILRYIQSIDDPSKRKAKPPQPKGKIAVAKVVLEDLLSDKSKSNECVQYITQQLEKHPDTELVLQLAKVVQASSNLTDGSMAKVVHLLSTLTKQEHLSIVVELLDQLSEGPLPESLLKCLCKAITAASGPLLETYLQKLSNLIGHVDPNEYYKLFDHLEALIDSLKVTVKASSAEARRLSIVNLADLYIMLDEQAILQALQPSEQRLVQLYVQRRKQRR